MNFQFTTGNTETAKHTHKKSQEHDVDVCDDVGCDVDWDRSGNGMERNTHKTHPKTDQPSTREHDGDGWDVM